MARFSKAVWRPVRNFRPDGQDRVLGMVVHIMDGSLEGTQSWFDNPESSSSSHFGTGRDGQLRQWVDTKDRAWAQGTGNHDYVSVENEGLGGQNLTAAQIEDNAQVYAWLHRVYSVPYKLADAPGEQGIGWHGMGGAAWGGHYDCPGSKIVAQRQQILDRAKQINSEDYVALTKEDAKTIWLYMGSDETRFDAYAYLRGTNAKCDELQTKVKVLEAKLDQILAKLG